MLYVICMFVTVVLIFDFNLNFILMPLKSVYNIKGYPYLLKNSLKQLKTSVMNRCDIKHISKKRKH